MNVKQRIPAVAIGLFIPLAVSSQPGNKPQLNLRTGEEIYREACIGCHGSHGEGQPKMIVGFDPPATMPDFTKCDQTTPEYNRDYKAVIRDGGPERAFSQIMPSFRDALTSEQMDMVIETLRSFCKENKWPRGEMNFPRALLTEKAFPEDETVITTGVNVQGAPGVTNELGFEKRYGKRNQLEVAIPFSFDHSGTGWQGGVGDIAIGWKRVLLSNLQSGTIVALQGEVVLPTGNRARGFGSGTTTFGTFASFGQMLTKTSFLQVQGGGDLPVNPAKSPQSVFLRAALGKSFSDNRGLGRLWSPMIEAVAARDLIDGAKTDWDVVPQFQVTVSRRQHIRANLGVSVPVTNTTGRPVKLMMYFLWDRADGGLFEGWR
jgi:mono/diheme cytochrome c family protein